MIGCCNECDGGLEVAEGVWDRAERMQCLCTAMHYCNMVTLNCG